MANKYYENYRKARQEVVQKREKSERSFGEQLFPVYIALCIGTVFIHGFSFMAAIIYPAYHAQILCGSYALGLFIGIALIFTFIEVPKWVLFSVVFENYYDSGEKSYVMGLIGTVCIVFSVWSSTNGLPLFVEWYSPEPNTKDIALIEEKYEKLEQKAVEFWQPQIDKNAKNAADFFEQKKKFYAKENGGKGRWRLSSHKSVSGPYNAILASLEVVQTSLNDRIKELNDEKNDAISEVKESNESIILVHDEKKSTATTFAFWVMLLLEMIYIFAIAGIKYYIYRSEQELEGLEGSGETNPKEQDKKIVHINNRTNKTEQPNNTESQKVAQGSTPIGFKKHGDVFVPDGSTTPHVWYYTKRGTWTKYSASTLRRMKKKAGASESWKSELEDLAIKCDDYKNQAQ